MTDKRLTRKLPVKITSFCMAVLMVCIAVGSMVGIALMMETGVYELSPTDAKINVMQNSQFHVARQLALDVLSGSANRAQYTAERSNADFQILSAVDGSEVWSSRENFGDFAASTGLRFTYLYWQEAMGSNYLGTWTSYYDFGGSMADYLPTEDRQEGNYLINIAVDPTFPVTDNLSLLNVLFNILYSFRFGIYGILAASAALFIACLVFLMYGAGRRTVDEEIHASWVTRIPLDVLAAGITIAVSLMFVALNEMFYYSYGGAWVFTGVVILAAASILVGCCYTVAVRVKLRTLWRNTVIWRICAFIKRVWLFIWRGAKELAGGLPLIWKLVVGMLALALVEFIFIMATEYDLGVLVFFWFIEKLVLGAAGMCLALMLRRLQKGGQALAAGDLSYQVDTSRMLWDFKKHGEDLNSIALGMNRAVEERLKSERMKTELITNVSHDIKTPLTSIINYSDLICKENCDNEKIREYSAVLLRQSERLKKLIEDLVDASKASTGSIEVNLAPFELDVLLTQAVGEYEQKLSDCRLELITKRPEKSVRIMADGRHMWRIFDNLMNNICKYAMPGTRVYLTVEERFGQAVVSFKNTSKYELDVSSDELMERFVRGDSSRSTEGSGLGLSIARSLTELQGGRLELTVDGDLFKAVLSFKEI